MNPTQSLGVFVLMAGVVAILLSNSQGFNEQNYKALSGVVVFCVGGFLLLIGAKP